VEEVLFFGAALGALGGAIGVVAMRNPFYSVLALIVHLFSLAVLFLLLSSAFLAAAQVVVYAGAVMVLYVFVVAYVGGTDESAWNPIPGQRLLAPLLGIAIFIELAIAVLASSLLALGTDGPDVKAGFGDPAAIGTLLLEKFLVPFEASSILLLLAAVGAVVLASKRATGDGSPGRRSPGVPGEPSPVAPASSQGTSDPGSIGTPREGEPSDPGSLVPGTPRDSEPGDPAPGARPATSEGVSAA
jgi:NADH-quinone oxidoreductase subunit J